MSLINSNSFLYKTVNGVKQSFSPLVNASTVVLEDGSKLEKDGKVYADEAVNAETLGGKAASDYVLEDDFDAYKSEISSETVMADLEDVNSVSGVALTNADLLAGMTYRQIMDSVYPVGRVIMTFEAEDPNVLYSWQTWEHTANGRFLLGADSSYAVGSTGGEATHKLMVEEMPSHIHRLALRGGSNSDGGNAAFADGKVWGQIQGGAWSNYSANKIESTGGDQPHNNMPPYLAVNMWKRTA